VFFCFASTERQNRHLDVLVSSLLPNALLALIQPPVGLRRATVGTGDRKSPPSIWPNHCCLIPPNTAGTPAAFTSNLSSPALMARLLLLWRGREGPAIQPLVHLVLVLHLQIDVLLLQLLALQPRCEVRWRRHEGVHGSRVLADCSCPQRSCRGRCQGGS